MVIAPRLPAGPGEPSARWRFRDRGRAVRHDRRGQAPKRSENAGR